MKQKTVRNDIRGDARKTAPEATRGGARKTAPETSQKITRILFVCHGNICRSPMAEFVLKDMVAKRGIASDFVIESAATSTEEIGNDMYPPAKRCLDKHGIAYKKRGARQLRATDENKWDMFIGMDYANVRNMARILGSNDKVHLMLSFAGEDAEVADPWYTGDFERTYEDIVRGCTGLLEYLGA